MTAARQAAQESMDNAVRFGQLQLAIAILGNAQVGHVTGAYTVTELSGKMHIVRPSEDAFYCLTCKSDNDDHTAITRLYAARLGRHGLGV